MLTLALLRGQKGIETKDAGVYYDERLVTRIKYSGPEISCVQFGVVFIAKLSVPDPTTKDEREYVTALESRLDVSEAQRDENNDLIWTPEVHLRRPHFDRNVSEVIVEFSAAAIGPKPSDEPKDPVLDSLQPVNATSPFSAMMEAMKPDLKAVKSEHPPVELEKQTLRVPIDLSLTLNLKTVRPPREGERDTTIAQLTLICDKQLACGIEVEKVGMTMNNAGSVIPLGEVPLPIVLPQSGECAFSYNIDCVVSHGYRRELVVGIRHTILDDKAPATIDTTWTSIVDFDDIKGPLPKTPTINSTPRVGSDLDAVSVRSLPRSPLSGITMTYKGPNKVKLGDEFEWELMVVNKSHRSRKVCVYFHSKEPVRPALPRLDERPLVAELQALRQRVVQNTEAMHADCGVIALTNELRIGNMAPQSSFEAKIKLKALSRGLHSVTGSAVVDMASGETYDTGELLNVIVE